AGGITFAQDEKSSKFFGMPGSAIAADCVDFVLSPNGIAQELVRMARHPLLSLAATKNKLKPRAQGAEELFLGGDHELGAIFALLRSRSGVDFVLYKHSTLKRRILRRMLLHKIEALPAYLKMLQAIPGEVDALFNDILISVTGFFRDPLVFQALKKKI